MLCIFTASQTQKHSTTEHEKNEDKFKSSLCKFYHILIQNATVPHNNLSNKGKRNIKTFTMQYLY